MFPLTKMSTVKFLLKLLWPKGEDLRQSNTRNPASHINYMSYRKTTISFNTSNSSWTWFGNFGENLVVF